MNVREEESAATVAQTPAAPVAGATPGELAPTEAPSGAGRAGESGASTGALLAAGAAALAVVAGAGEASAQMMDNNLLNALLSAEYNAIDAYTAGAGILMAPPAGDALASAAPTVLAVAVHFQSQHRDHAEQLRALITTMGGTPVPMPTMSTFTAPSGFTPGVANVIKLAANAEKAAAIAYADTLKAVTSSMSAKLLAAIGGVETQHYIVLSLLARGVVNATAMTMAMANDVVPSSFVANVGTSTSSLEALADFTYSA